MEKESRGGQTELYTMVNGKTDSLKVMEYSTMQMVTFIKVLFTKIEQTVSEFICTLTDRNTKGIGVTTCNMEKALKLSKTGANMKVTSSSARKTE